MGCSATPLLYRTVTKPFMEWMKEDEKVGKKMSSDNQVIALIYSFAVAGAFMACGLLFFGI
ncbi:hypothetical protein [Paludifilum halophilum]|uniref:Uncharacterized protein n=1 Tax=Paludifilum halophilum TaxID=1642702 RepID=A0A235B6V6_9BACL|nr:hypothetical protein [Paludifilum halophilum]OYD07962.1 hypothetical protein CHM34_07520 [Paludifilum halophilum]